VYIWFNKSEYTAMTSKQLLAYYMNDMRRALQIAIISPADRANAMGAIRNRLDNVRKRRESGK
jgi:hypothetical protein